MDPSSFLPTEKLTFGTVASSRVANPRSHCLRSGQRYLLPPCCRAPARHHYTGAHPRNRGLHRVLPDVRRRLLFGLAPTLHERCPRGPETESRRGARRVHILCPRVVGVAAAVYPGNG